MRISRLCICSELDLWFFMLNICFLGNGVLLFLFIDTICPYLSVLEFSTGEINGFSIWSFPYSYTLSLCDSESKESLYVGLNAFQTAVSLPIVLHNFCDLWQIVSLISFLK